MVNERETLLHVLELLDVVDDEMLVNLGYTQDELLRLNNGVQEMYDTREEEG